MDAGVAAALAALTIALARELRWELESRRRQRGDLHTRRTDDGDGQHSDSKR